MFEKLTGTPSNTQTLAISETEAMRLLFGYCRDTTEAIASLRGNPGAQMVGDNCTVRWNPALSEALADKNHCDCGNRLWSKEAKSKGVCPDCEGADDTPAELETRLNKAFGNEI